MCGTLCTTKGGHTAFSSGSLAFLCHVRKTTLPSENTSVRVGLVNL